MRINPEIKAKAETRRRAAAAVQRAVTRLGFDAVAERIGTSAQAVRNWNAGSNLPTPFMAGIILGKFNPDGSAR